MPLSQFDVAPTVPPWRDLFTGRTAEIAIALSHLGIGPETARSASKPLLVYYGISGIGKTAIRIATEREVRRMHPGVRGIVLDLDSPRYAPDYPLFELFGKVIYPALKRARVRAPLFLVYYIAWASNLRETSAISRSSIMSELLGTSQEATDIASEQDELLNEDWSEVFGTASELLSGAKLVTKAIEFARTKAAERKFKNTFSRIELAHLTSEEFETYAPLVMASDIQTHFERRDKRTKRVCFLIDGFERIQSTESGRPAEWGVQQLCANLCIGEHAERFRFIVFGRSRLNWDEFYPARGAVRWEDLTQSISISGLTLVESDDLVTACERWYESQDAKGQRIAQQLRAHRRALLTSSKEDDSDGRASHEDRVHPLALTLAIEIVATHPDEFDVSMLGSGPSEMRESFLRYLRKPERALLEVLCVLREFSQFEFRVAVEEHLIVGVTVQSFVDLTNDGRYCIAPAVQDAYFRVHHLLSETVLENMRSAKDDRMLAIMRPLLGRLLSCLDINGGAAALRARVRTALLILEHYGHLSQPQPIEWLEGISTIDSTIPRWFALPELISAYLQFGIAYGPSGRPGWFSVEIYCKALARAIELIVIHGDYATAVRLSEHLLEFMKEASGDDTLEFARATTLASRATSLQRLARVSEASPLLDELRSQLARWFKGRDIRETMLAARVAHTLGVSSPLEGIDLLHRVSELLDPDLSAEDARQHRYVIETARMHLALGAHLSREALNALEVLKADRLLFSSGDALTTARELAKSAEVWLANGQPSRALELAEEAVQTVDSASYVAPSFRAEIYEMAGKIARQLENDGRAISLLQTALEAHEEVNGVDSLFTVASRTALAFCLARARRFAESIELLSRNIAIMEAHFGMGHIEVATALINRANVMADAGAEAKELRPLYSRALRIAEKSADKDTYAVAIVLVNWGTFMYEQGKLVPAARYLKKGIESLRGIGGFGEGHLARALFNLGGIRWANGDFDGARELLLEAREHVVLYKGPDSDELRMIAEHLGRLPV